MKKLIVVLAMSMVLSVPVSAASYTGNYLNLFSFSKSVPNYSNALNAAYKFGINFKFK